jgi:hypothetical protein
MLNRAAPLFCALLVLGCSAQDDPIPNHQIQRFEIDLDKAPEDRWTHIVKAKKIEIHALLSILKAGNNNRGFGWIVL